MADITPAKPAMEWPHWKVSPFAIAASCIDADIDAAQRRFMGLRAVTMSDAGGSSVVCHSDAINGNAAARPHEDDYAPATG